MCQECKNTIFHCLGLSEEIKLLHILGLFGTCDSDNIHKLLINLKLSPQLKYYLHKYYPTVGELLTFNLPEEILEYYVSTLGYLD
jgi:hypothetical protein